MAKIFHYVVYEDNAGGLTLAVFRGSRAVYSHGGYEYNLGQLSQDLISLLSSDPADWDGCDDDPAAVVTALAEAPDWGIKVVAVGDSRGRQTLYRSRMGVAARLEFGVK